METIDDNGFALWQGIVAGSADEHRMFSGFRPVGRFARHARLVDDGCAVLAQLRNNTQFMVEDELSHTVPDCSYLGIDEVVGEGEALEPAENILCKWRLGARLLKDAAQELSLGEIRVER